MTSSRRLFCVLTAVVLLCHAIPARADENPLLQPAIEKIADLKAKIPTWDRNAGLAQVLTLTVAVLAFLATFLQPWNRRWVQAATAAIGLTVGITTIVLDKGFTADHRGYKEAALTGNDLISRLQAQVAIFKDSPDLRDDPADPFTLQLEKHAARLRFISENIQPITGEMTKLQVKMAASFFPSPFGVAYAQSKAETPLKISAAGECNTLWQAQELSYNAAVEEMASELRSRTKQPGNAMEPLRGYVRQFASKSQYQAGKEPRSGTYRFQTVLTLSPLFLSWSAMGPMLQRLPQAQPVSPDLRGTATVNLSAKAGVSQAVPVNVTGAKPADGNFQFILAAEKPPSGDARLLIRSMAIFESGSAAYTLWGFTVAANGKPVIEIPAQRFDDSKHPTRCDLSDSGWAAPLPPSSGPYQIQITGYRETESRTSR